MQARNASRTRLNTSGTRTSSQERLERFWKKEAPEYEKEFARIDRMDFAEVQTAAEYAQEIADHLKEIEKVYYA